MSDEHRFEREARAWLELGPTDAPDRVVEAALLEIEQTSQERVLWIPWRLPTMTPRLGLAATALVAVVGLGLIYLNLPGRGGVGASSPTPTGSSPTSTPLATAVDYSTIPGWIVFEHFGLAPDGSTAAFDNDPHSLWLFRADGSGLHELAPGLPANGKVSFDISPDGTHVVFGTYDLPAQIWEVGIEGGDPQLLSTDCSGQPGDCEEGSPAYSSDGARIAFVRGTDRGYVIAVRDLDSGAVTLFEATREGTEGGWLAEPAWSPDDQQIVYHNVIFDVAQDKVVDTNLFIVNANDSGRRELDLLADTPVGDADWSPDGSRIVFSSCPIHEFNSNCADVYTARPDGTDVQLLTRPSTGYGAPTWTPDGLHIMFWGPRNYYLMDPDGSNARPINGTDFGDTNGYGYYGRWQPTNP